MDITKINAHIYRIQLPYKDIFTTVYLISTPQGVVIFDAASYETDLDNYIQPALDELGIVSDTIKYIFISHNHKDHAGCLGPIISRYPHATIVSRSPGIAEQYADYTVLNPKDEDTILDILKIITIPGHTGDSCGLLDARTNTLVSGDCLQVYGIVGSGDWAANITLPAKHIQAIKKLRTLPINTIVAAHDYEPYGYRVDGKEAVGHMLDACISPLKRVYQLILDNPQMNDTEICALFNTDPNKPTIQEKVITAVRSAMNDGLFA